MCLHFSPSDDYLVIGTANATLFDNQEVPESVLMYNMAAARVMGYNNPALAYVYGINRRTRKAVERTARVKEFLRYDIPEYVKKLNANPSFSLNTIIWHRRGLAYGTTKGLVVLVPYRAHN